jgi:hypothetical protein
LSGRVDDFGNIYSHRASRDERATPVLMGAHLDKARLNMDEYLSDETLIVR